jgi:hypothetical protein
MLFCSKNLDSGPPDAEPNAAPASDGSLLQMILRHFETTPRVSRSIDELAQGFGIRRRSLYDFISVCSTFGICRRGCHTSVEWVGRARMGPILNAIREEAEAEPHDREITEIFNDSLDFSLQRTAVVLLKLFFYLRVKFLDLRMVSHLFASRSDKHKTMRRKLYTVSTALAIIGIVKKTSVPSEIQLNVPIDSEGELIELGVSSMLNTQRQVERERVCQLRRRQFDAVCAELAAVQRLNAMPESMKQALPSLGKWTAT